MNIELKNQFLICDGVNYEDGGIFGNNDIKWENNYWKIGELIIEPNNKILIRNDDIEVYPKGLIYEDNFITLEEEKLILAYILSQKWDLSIRRKTQHYGYRYIYNKYAPIQTDPTPEIPSNFHFLIERLKIKTGFHFDQLIVNHYEPGQGIAPHTDDIKLFGECVLSISLLSDIPMDFTLDDFHYTQILKRFSVCILQKQARWNWKHSIQSTKVNRKERISLTFRVMKNKK